MANFNIVSVAKYCRMELQDYVLHTAEHDQDLSFNDSCIRMSNSSYAVIDGFFIVKMKSESRVMWLPLVKVTKLKSNAIVSPFVMEVIPGDR